MAPPTAIHVEHLSKRYRLGARERAERSLRESLTEYFAAPFRRGKSHATAQHLWALEDVTFEVAAGEVLGVVGRNGAGKSTLLKVLSRITPPTAGRAEIRGRVGSLLEVGTGFHAELTGRENVYLSGAILGMRRAEISRRFDAIVSFAEVERFIDTPIKHYSSGMHLRLAFAVAAHLEPEVLLVDEVLAVGDAAFQRKCLGRMRDEAMRGRTVVFVSHNMAAVAQLCSRALWLSSGRVRMDGSAGEVVARYLAEGAEIQPERRWPDLANAPGDERVRLTGASVRQSGAVTSVVDINQPIEVTMELEALRPLEDLVPAVNVHNAEGICLFSVADWRPNRLAAGRYVTYLRLPPQVLAEGRIELLLQLVFFSPHVQSVVLPGALSFLAADSQHPDAVRGPYKGAWPGVLRLHGDWAGFRPASTPSHFQDPS